MSFLNDTKRTEIMLKENSAAFVDIDNMLFGPKYKEFVAKSINLKNKSKELFEAISPHHPKKQVERSSPFEGPPFFKPEEKGGKTHLLLLASRSHSTNHKLEDTQGVRLNYQLPLLNILELLPKTEFP